ncbi:MAG: GNAT family N-acetyltransferase [Pedobacter sp.]|nr:MAG: GNAT family N-acetyltransferase [Pedobacter sp.]
MELEVSSEKHLIYVEEIRNEMEDSAKKRGTGIAKRSSEYLGKQIMEGNSIIAIDENGTWAGFCYIETWTNGEYVANSGLIVHPDYRKSGIATRIKAKAFELSRAMFPTAKIIGITTSLAVMKINSDLGYQPVTLSELPADDAFWKGCQTCANFDILTRTNRKHCLCTGMQYDPEEHKKEQKDEKWNFLKESTLYER